MNLAILDLQYYQEMHDRRYHIDIYSKPLMSRLNHLFNHLVKYSSSDVKRQDTYSDALACILSMANSLNMDISDEFSKTEQVYVSQIIHIKPKYHESILDEMYKQNLAALSKLLEGYDHTESLQYKDKFKSHILDIFIILCQYRVMDEYSLYVWETEYINKISNLKKKHIFYARYHTEDMKDPLYVSIHNLNGLSKV